MKKALLFLLTIMFISCTDSILEANQYVDEAKLELTEDENLSIIYGNPRMLDDEEIIGLAKSFASKINFTRNSIPITGTLAKKFFLKKQDLSKTRSGNSSSDSIPLGVVSLVQNKDSGYAVVFADDRSPCVLAYVPKGKYEDKDSTGAGIMLKLSEASIITEVENVDSIVEHNLNNALSKIKQYTGKDSISVSDARKEIGIGTRSKVTTTLPTTIYSMVPPVTKTEWSQNSPYNLYLPECYVSTSIGNSKMHYPAGCGVVAAAQALAATAPNITICETSIDWTYLTQKSKVEFESYGGGDTKAMNMAATLYRDIYEQTGSVPVIDPSFVYGKYEDTSIPGVSGSSMKTSSLVAYLRKYVSCEDYIDKYDADALMLSMSANQKFPCVAIMGASRKDETGNLSSHAWVIDGYALCKRSTRELVKKYDVYFHANMGWEGEEDGYYKVNADTSMDFENANGIYNIDFWEIPEIHQY